MREILFRGKSVDGDVWLHGSLTITDIDRAGRETKEYRITNVRYCFDESGFSGGSSSPSSRSSPSSGA